MTKTVEMGPGRVFGSRARARILGYLAQIQEPQTGYAIAKALGIGVSNAYPELERLERWEIVSSRPDPNGRRVYSLADDDLRRFLLRRVRILSSKDWFLPSRVSLRETQAKEAENLRVDLPKGKRRGKRRPFAAEFQRPREKDRVRRR